MVHCVCSYWFNLLVMPIIVTQVDIYWQKHFLSFFAVNLSCWFLYKSNNNKFWPLICYTLRKFRIFYSNLKNLQIDELIMVEIVSKALFIPILVISMIVLWKFIHAVWSKWNARNVIFVYGKTNITDKFTDHCKMVISSIYLVSGRPIPKLQASLFLPIVQNLLKNK